MFGNLRNTTMKKLMTYEKRMTNVWRNQWHGRLFEWYSMENLIYGDNKCMFRYWMFLGLYQFKSFLNFWKSYFNWVMINKIEPRCTWMLLLKTYICFNSTSNNCVIVGRGNIATTKIEALFMACNFIFSQAPDHHNLWCER